MPALVNEKSPPRSEDNGLAAITPTDLKIYSVGISTGASAEIRMALDHEKRKIVATTLDSGGADYARKEIEKAHLNNQIEVKIEDVSKPLPYSDGEFDFIYARLVLHYLSDPNLKKALHELGRVLKPRGKFYIVVRSEKTKEAVVEKMAYDEESALTTFSAQGKTYKRRFHSEESMRGHLSLQGFKILKISEYEEQLYLDFERTIPSLYIDTLIEILAEKL